MKDFEGYIISKHNTTVKHITLKDSGVPVVFFCPEETITYLKEEDLIGFVSSKVMPIYCQLSFLNEDVDDFRHYDA